MKALAPCLLAAALLAGCAAPDGQLAQLARKRLALAPEVAWSKYSRNMDVYDPVRESIVLEHAVSAARGAGLDEEPTRRFFSAQMEASRRIQWEWFHAWRKDYPTPGGRALDLTLELRPRLDEITRRQILALARGARPLSLAQLTLESERFLPKNALSNPAASSASTPGVTSQR